MTDYFIGVDMGDEGSYTVKSQWRWNGKGWDLVESHRVAEHTVGNTDGTHFALDETAARNITLSWDKSALVE